MKENNKTQHFIIEQKDVQPCIELTLTNVGAEEKNH